MLTKVYIGTSGWHYDSWRHNFYSGVPTRYWFKFYCTHFNSVEINASFYRRLNISDYRRWHDETPDSFRFSLKGNRLITHYRKLHDPLPGILFERERALGLGKKLAVVLWQLPTTFPKQYERLEQFVAALAVWPEVRHVIEFRHSSWFDVEVADCVHAHRIAICQSDAEGWGLWDTVTTDFVYIRLHGMKVRYASSYDDATLYSWVEKVTEWLRARKRVFVYFNNTGEGHASLNAQRLTRLVHEALER